MTKKKKPALCAYASGEWLCDLEAGHIGVHKSNAPRGYGHAERSDEDDEYAAGRAVMGPVENYKTAGPWIVGKQLSNGLILITNRCGLGVAESMRGDAPLIAAAPDMLAACSSVLRAIKWSVTGDRMTADEQADMLRAAILKAEGR